MLVLLSAACESATAQAALGGRAIHPSWSPDGQWLAFTRYAADGMGEIFRVKPDGTQLANLTHTAGDEMLRSGPGTGARVAFIRGNDIWTLPVNGGAAVNLTSTRAIPERGLAWSR